MAYWFNVDTKQVEEDGSTDPKAQLLGPYDTREEAAQALESAAKRTEQWDRDDAEWENN